MTDKNVSFWDEPEPPKNEGTAVNSLQDQSPAPTELNSNETPTASKMEQNKDNVDEGLDDDSFGENDLKMEYNFPDLDNNGMDYADKITENVLEKLKLSLGLSMTGEEDHERLTDFFQ